MLLIGAFIYGDFSIVFKACFIFGFLIPLLIKNLDKKTRYITFLFLLVVPSIGIMIAHFKFDESLTYKPFLLWTLVVISGTLINLLYNRLKMRENNKLALLLSVGMLLIIPSFRPFDEGNYAVLAVISYLTAGYFILIRDHSLTLKPLLFLFIPYLVVHLADAIVSGSFTGLYLVMPAFFISIGLLILYQHLTINSSRKLIFSLVVMLLILPVLWLLQENFANYIFSKQNSIINSSHFKFITSSNGKLNESSDKKISVFLFTSAYCGNCEKEFPYYSDLAKKYSSDTTYGFYTTFLCFREKDTIFYENLTKQDYEFEWSLAHDSRQIYEDFKMQGVPSLLIINEKNEVLYNGYCRIRPWLFINSPDRIINKYIASSE